MASGRSAKRARKKDRRNTRREEWRRVVQKRRRQRWGIFLGSLGVVGIGLAVAYFAFGGDEDPAATPSATPVQLAAPVKEPVACGAKLPKSAGSKKEQYTKAADQKLDPDKTYVLELKTSCGDISIELDQKNSPKTANSIVFLAREKFFDGIVFHRIAPEITVIQGGDPEGSGSGGAGYDVVDEPPKDLKYTEGVVAMAKTGADPAGTAGSQFFIVYGDGAAVLPPDYGLLGEVVDGMDVVQKIADTGTGTDGPPEEWTYIESATITVDE
jgi:cyclophilin family peptidyl-prolyl cis-trans isomerase